MKTESSLRRKLRRRERDGMPREDRDMNKLKRSMRRLDRKGREGLQKQTGRRESENRL